MRDLLSIIIPAYNESEGIAFAVDTVYDIVNNVGIPFEIIVVDDGSKDNCFSAIQSACERDKNRIKGIAFSRNFGKEAAIYAGIAYAKGDCAVIIDSDLQHPPDVIPQMYNLWKQGYKIVEGVKQKRQKESLLYRVSANTFYSVFGKAVGADLRNSSDFKLIDREVLDVLLRMPERKTFFRGMTFWTGFKMTKIIYQVQPRMIGKTSWSFGPLLRYAVNNVVSFSSAPLGIITGISAVMLFVALLFGIRALNLYYTGQAAGGVTTLVVLILLVGGLILLSLSIIGRYISNIYDEIKFRPRFLVEQSTDEDSERIDSLNRFAQRRGMDI